VLEGSNAFEDHPFTLPIGWLINDSWNIEWLIVDPISPVVRVSACVHPFSVDPFLLLLLLLLLLLYENLQTLMLCH